MDIQEILQKPFDKVLDELTVYSKGKDEKIASNRQAYDGDHAILHDTARAPKLVGDTASNQRLVKHTSEVITMQERIVESAVTFLFGEPVSLVSNDESTTAIDAVNDVWKTNKLDYFNKALARDLFIECKVAELWHIPKGETIRIRVSLLSKRTGYSFYPHFDEFGNMDAFTVRYTTKDADGKEQQTVLIHTDAKIIDAYKPTSGNWIVTPRANPAGKILVVYYEQDKPEWKGVETEINRYEYLMSNHADTNDYNGSPLTMIKGEVDNMPRKEEMGKVVYVKAETDQNGQVSYPGGVSFVSWDQSPESIKLEMDNLKDIIYSMTQTPDLSFGNVKGMNAVSGIALRLMFSDALFKARNKQEIFGPGLERRLSIIKSILALTDVNNKAEYLNSDIDVVFNDVLPQDLESLIRSLSLARGGEAIMSEESAIKANPLVTDAERDIEILSEEKTALKSFAESYSA